MNWQIKNVVSDLQDDIDLLGIYLQLKKVEDLLVVIKIKKLDIGVTRTN